MADPQGREWFVVRKAEVRLAEDQTLIPHVKMGVEAGDKLKPWGEVGFSEAEARN